MRGFTVFQILHKNWLQNLQRFDIHGQIQGVLIFAVFTSDVRGNICCVKTRNN